MVTARSRMTIALAVAAGVASALASAPANAKGSSSETPPWLGEELPLPLPVRTQEDITFKTAAERQYLIFNLMAGGKVAYQKGEYAIAVEKWEQLLKVPGLDPQVGNAVIPQLAEARRRVARPAVANPPPPPKNEHTERPPPPPPEEAEVARPARPARSPDGRTTVNGVVSGGGQVGPGGAVVWLKRVDGSTPPPAPAAGRFITQRDKTFLPHVLAVPVGTTVEFRNEDRIYHNVFSLNKPNDFDAGIRASGTTYTRTFSKVGPV